MKKVERKLNNILGEGDLQAIRTVLNKLFFKQAAEMGYGQEWIKINDEKFQREFGQQAV